MLGPTDLFTGAKFMYSCVAFRYLVWRFKRLAILPLRVRGRFRVGVIGWAELIGLWLVKTSQVTFVFDQRFNNASWRWQTTLQDLNIEQITPDPVMADPELFCLCGWCTRKPGSVIIHCVRLFSKLSAHFPCVPQSCRGTNCRSADLWGRSAMSASFLGVHQSYSESNSRSVIIIL